MVTETLIRIGTATFVVAVVAIGCVWSVQHYRMQASMEPVFQEFTEHSGCWGHDKSSVADYKSVDLRDNLAKSAGFKVLGGWYIQCLESQRTKNLTIYVWTPWDQTP